MRTLLHLLVAVVVLTWAPAACAVEIDIRVGVGSGCAFPTVQQAIDAASGSLAVTSNIKIAQNTTYSAQQLTITNKNVRLIGGYANCNQTSPDGSRTVLSGAGGGANTVIAVSGRTVEVAYSNLDITGGDEATSSSGVGGGVSVAGGPHDLVSFDNTFIHDNRAGYGGGVWVRNDFSTNIDDVYLYFGDNVHIDSNYGAYGGGGLWCSNAKVTFVGNNSYIARNSTAGTVGTVVINGSGGGVRAENCGLWIGATSALGTLSQNTAGGNGGGLSISGERAIARLYTRRANRPPAVLLNTAGGVGGGIDVGSSAQVYGYDLVVANNTARGGGGGISLFDGDAAPDANLLLRGTLEGAPSDPGAPAGAAVNCDPSLRCNRISDNQAVDLNGSDVPGAALRLSAVASLSSIAGSSADLHGTEFSGNQGESLLRTYSGDFASTVVYLTGTAIVDNRVSGNLLHNPNSGGYLDVLHTTIAGNAIGSGGAALRTIDRFSLRNSIVWQPGVRVVYNIDGSTDATHVDYLLASDLLGIAPSTHNVIADPQFDNASAGDYGLAVNSPALDYAPRIADQSGNDPPSADHLARPVDLASIPNEFGPYDLGAYERQFVCAADTIFCSGFGP